jgi:hypothetical protein
VPELRSIVALRVRGPRYWPLQLDVSAGGAHADVLRSLSVYVQRKGGHLPYEADPLALRSLLCRPYALLAPQLERLRALRDGAAAAPSADAAAATELAREQYLLAFGTDTELREFARHHCAGGDARAAFCGGVLFACLAKGTPEMVFHHLALWRAAELARGGALGGLRMRALRTLLDFYGETDAPAALGVGGAHGGGGGAAAGGGGATPLLQAEFLHSVRATIEAVLGGAAGGALDGAVRDYLRDGAMPADAELGARLGELLAFHKVPSRFELDALERALAARAPRSHAGWLLAACEALPHTPTTTLMKLAAVYSSDRA